MATMKEIIDFETDSVREKDMVNHPPHYNEAPIECIDAIKAALGDGYKYYIQGNIIKYMWRYEKKNGVEDLEKAQWYLNELIDTINNNGNKS